MFRKLLLSFVLVAALVATVGLGLRTESVVVADAGAQDAPALNGQAKYIFVFIGDGMGIAQRNAAELYMAATEHPDMRPEDVRLLMNTFPAQGVNTTYDLTSVIPDSASTATAISTGHKTASGVIGVSPDGSEVYTTIAETAKEMGWRVGVITTVSIDHATPAAFYAHQSSRSKYYEITMDLANSGFDYFAGGPPLAPTGKEGDQPSSIEAASANGYTIVDTMDAFTALTPDNLPIWVMNAAPQDSNAMHYDLDGVEGEVSLADYVAKGIELLDNPTGFFMAVEGGKIDWACHANDAAASIHDTLALEDALAVAYAFYEQHPDETLIVVTGDHETGGLSIGFAGTRYSAFYESIQHQTMSFVAFNDTVLTPYKESHTAADARLEDLYADIEAAFGLKVLPAEELEALKAKAEGDDAEAQAELRMVLTDLELAVLQDAFARSMMGEEERSEDEYTYLLYGGYEPLTVKLTTILNQKAGIGWTSYSHTGVPVQTSAIGVGAEQFNGFYDQVDLYTFMARAAGL